MIDSFSTDGEARSYLTLVFVSIYDILY